MEQIRQGFFTQNDQMQTDSNNQNMEDSQAQPVTNHFFKRVNEEGDCQMEESKEENLQHAEVTKYHQQLLGALNLEALPKSASFWM